MAEVMGMEYLRKKLEQKKERVDLRYKFYDMKQLTRDFGISTPPKLQYFQSCLGWCGKAVDSLADRLNFREFQNDNLDMTGIFNMNNPDLIFDSAILSALISSCSFVYVSADNDGFPRLQVIDGANATGMVDTVTGLLDEGYAVLERDPETQNPTVEAYFDRERTVFYRKGEPFRVYKHNAGQTLLVPVIYRPDAKRPFGHSRISRAEMSLVGSAIRTIKRSEISAEFYSYPQKYISGTAEDADVLEKWQATMATLLQFTKDEDGERPTVGQFQQASMGPHLDQLKMFASLFGGEAGLTLDDLGFPTANPSSAEALKSSHEMLRMTARKAQKYFGSAFLNVGYVAACLRDDYPYRRNIVYLTKPKWDPVFEPDAAAMSAIGDSLLKLDQAVPGYVTEEKIRDLTGM